MQPLQSIIPPTALGNSKGVTAGAAAAGAAAGAATGAAAAGGGMSAEEAAACGGSSASNVRGHCSIVTREGWEEQRHLLSGADYHARAAAAGAVEGMAAGEGNVVAAGRGMAMGTAGAMNEEFLRDYFNDVSI